MELTKEKLLEMYRRMVTIRLFESSLQPYYEQDHIPCSAHLSIGEEAVSVGACSALGERDYILSTHRGHGHVLARGANMLSTAAEIFTKATGCTGGKGGTQHLSDLNSYVLATNGITGGGIALAGGAGLSMKMQKTGQVCLCFFGDGASNRGVFHSTLNMASIWKVPTIFLCCNNQFAISTKSSKSCANPNISARAIAYNMPGYRVDGTDVLAVYDTVKNAAERARKGEGPSLIECITYRWLGHSLADLRRPPYPYSAEGEAEEWMKTKDPINLFRHKLTEMRYLTNELADKIEAEVKQEVNEAMNYAMDSPEPSPESIFQYIYA